MKTFLTREKKRKGDRKGRRVEKRRNIQMDLGKVSTKLGKEGSRKGREQVDRRDLKLEYHENGGEKRKSLQQQPEKKSKGFLGEKTCVKMNKTYKARIKLKSRCSWKF